MKIPFKIQICMQSTCQLAGNSNLCPWRCMDSGVAVAYNSCGMRQAVTAGSNPITLKKGIDKTCDFLVAKLKEVARPVKGTEDIKVRRASSV